MKYNNTIRKNIIILFIILFICVFFIPELLVLGWMKVICPLGSSKDEIKETIAQNRWAIKNEKSNIRSFKNCVICKDIDGDQYISADITNYFGIYIDAFWGFNEKGELVDIYVRKSQIGL